MGGATRVADVFVVGRQFTHGYRPYHSHQLWWFAFAIVLLALLVLAVGALLVAGKPSRRSALEEPLIPSRSPSAAEQILAQRLARGEIDPDEYRRRRDILRELPPQAG